jgi:hypothetical protein
MEQDPEKSGLQRESVQGGNVDRWQQPLHEVWCLVTHPATSGEILDDVSHGAHRWLAERIAEHPMALPETLERLSYHPAAEVRAAVAENLNTPTHIIFALTQLPN